MRNRSLIAGLGALVLIMITLALWQPDQRLLDRQERSKVDKAPVTVKGPDIPDFEEKKDPAEGDDAPALVGSDALGNEIAITPGQDQPTLLVFMSHWCDECTSQADEIVAWSKRRTEPDGLRIVAVITESDELRMNWPPAQWLAEREWTFEALYDSDAGDARAAYGVTAYPFFALLGPEGKIVRREQGLLGSEGLDVIADQALETAATQVDEPSSSPPVEAGTPDEAGPSGDEAIPDPPAPATIT